jgi:hypothetical protein
MAKGGELLLYETSVTKGFSGTDNRQIPTEATCTFYFQGATVSGISDTTISVYDVNDIKVGDILEKFNADDWSTANNQMTVSSITDVNTFEVSWSVGAVSMVAGDRLVVINRAAGQDKQPRIYGSDSLDDLDNPSGETGGFVTDAYLSSDATTGLLSTYVQARYFDLVITDAAIETSLRMDQQAGQGRDKVNATDVGLHADGVAGRAALNRIVLTDALTRIARAGHPVSSLWLPRGVGFIDEDIDIVGGSSAVDIGVVGDVGSTIKADTGFSDSKMFYIGAGLTGGKIKGVTFDGNSSNVTANILELTQGSSNLWLEDCVFQNIDGKALVLGAAGQDIDKIWIENCLFEDINDTAIEIISCVRAQINGNQFISVAETGGHAIEIAVASGDLGEIISIDGNQFTNVANISTNTTGQVLKAVGQAATGGTTHNDCFSLSFSRNQIDTHQGTTSTPAVSVRQFYYIDVDDNKMRNCKGSGVTIDSCYYFKANDNNIGLNSGTLSNCIYVAGTAWTPVQGTITGNIVADSDRSGIHFADGSVVVVNGNSIFNCNRNGTSADGGIKMVGTLSTTLCGNTVLSNDNSIQGAPSVGGYGVLLSGTSRTVITGNVVANHTDGWLDQSTDTDTVIAGNFEG